MFQEEQESDPVAEVIRREIMPCALKSDKAIHDFLNMTGDLINKKMAVGDTSFAYINKIKSVVVQSALLNQSGSPVFLYFKKNLTKQTYCFERIIRDPAFELPDEGFEQTELAKKLPITTLLDGAEAHITPGMVEISEHAINHIKEDNKDRLPEQYMKLGRMEFAAILQSAVNLAVQIALHSSPTYLKAVYRTEHGICYLCPWISSEDTQLCILVKVDNYGKAQVKTVLPLTDELRDRVAMTTGLYAW